MLDATIHGVVSLRESAKTVAALSADQPSRTATLECTAPVLPLLPGRPTQLFTLTWSVPGRTPLAKDATWSREPSVSGHPTASGSGGSSHSRDRNESRRAVPHWVMASYETLAQFYDAVNGEPRERIRQLLDFIARYHPGAESVLELGCGTGAILAGLGSGLSLTGIDLSDEMLAYARHRCPPARLIHGDITSFSLDDTFDVVVCVFDTLNHVTTFEGWLSTFERVREHLNVGGLFIFDVNTVGRLRELGEMAPWVHDFEGHTLIMEVELDDEPLATWDIRVFEQRGAREYVLHHERIAELGVPLGDIKRALAPQFTLLDETDTQGDAPTDESSRALFVFRVVEDRDD